MATPEFANQFAKEWLRSWNAHDLDAILSHYADDFEMISPYIVAISAEPSGILKGKKLIGEYWEKALVKYPELHFDLCNVLIGVQSIVIYYKGLKGMVTETFVFNQHGRVIQSTAHYE